MYKKEVDPNDEEAILKGKIGYRVVWQEEEEINTDDVKEPVSVWSQDVKDEKKEPDLKRKVHHIHKHQHSIEFVAGVLGFIFLVFLMFVKPIIFWIVLWIAIFSLLLSWLVRKLKSGYVDKMQQNVVYLKIKNPILTGFEIALGIGIFAGICILIGLVILLIIAIGAGYGIWSLLSGFFL